MPVYESIKNADNKIKISAANRDSVVFGWDNAVSFLADKVKAGAKAIAIDGWYGIDFEKIAVALKEKVGAATLLSATDLFVSREAIVAYNQPYVTDDPGFGKVNKAGVIEDIIEKNAGPYLESYRLFDVYEGERLGEGKKSVAYSLVFRAKDRTLEDADVSGPIAKILEELEKIGIELRK